MGKQLKKIAKYSMATALATSALVPSAVAFAADEKVVATDITKVVVENEKGQLVELDLEQYSRAALMGAMKDTDIKYVVANNDEVYDLEQYSRALLMNAGNKEVALELIKEDAIKDAPILKGEISEDGKAVADETPEEKVNETFFYNLAA